MSSIHITRNVALATLRALVLVATVSFVAAGCGGSKGRDIDVSSGEYYSEEEYAELSRGEKESYCAALESELSMLQGQVDERRGELTATRKQIESLKNQISPIERELLRIDSDIRSLTSQIAELEALPKEWVIQPGECLWIIAGYEQVYSDPVRWPRIFRANTDKIVDPEWIYPDTALVIPRDWPKQHVVSLDESLSLISSYWEVYSSTMEWPKLYEANKDAIADPDLIHPEQVLKIPR
ncbi:MAG: LysM peptidoglycan-binding domain-containing protein [Candidatus Latescibacterota bacterium]|jgi:nucleoid-associated protein YgaU